MTKRLKSTALTLILAFSLFTILTSAPIFPTIPKISKALAESLDESRNVDILVVTRKNGYGNVEASIIELGGQVNLKLKYVDVVAASMPADKIADLMANRDALKIYKDDLRFPSADTPDLTNLDVEAGIASIYQGNYETLSLTVDEIEGIGLNNFWNPIAMGAEDVWLATNDYGQGSLVVIIDTGLYKDHFMFAGSSIIGGIDMSPDVGTTYEGWDAPWNHYHGTHVAGIVASTGGIIVPETDLLAQSIEYHSGMTLEDAMIYGFPFPGFKVIWLLGMAPAADLYAIKAFPHTGAGVPQSRILAAMEHALDLHLSGHYDVDVISMSLGGPTMYDGRDIEDQLVDTITTHGITVVTSAGNEGPAMMTTGSPGTANTAITVGAAATTVQTRVFWDMNYNTLGIGEFLFVSETPQIHAMSNRGPTSDGRQKPTLAATGLFVLSALTPPYGDLGWVSGTSMACPAVSGTVALLNTYAEAFPATHARANPLDYKQALRQGAVFLPGYDEYDQGAGFLNAYNSLAAFVNDPIIGSVYTPLLPFASFGELPTIPVNPWKETSVYEFDIVDLAPGHNIDFNFEVIDSTGSIELEISSVDLGVDPFEINSFEVYIQSAKRSGYWYFIETANVWDDALFHIDDYDTWLMGAVAGAYYDPYTRLAPIEPGYIKIVIENDWTSFDSLSGHIKITVKQEESTPEADIEISGCLKDGDWTGWIPIAVPENTIEAEIILSWIRDWSGYPTNDMDIVVAYFEEGSLVFNYDGATWNSPERVILENPPNTIFVYVDAYALYTMFQYRHREFFNLEIYFTSG